MENLTSDSQGQYRCMAANLAGQAEALFSLAIEGKIFSIFVIGATSYPTNDK